MQTTAWTDSNMNFEIKARGRSAGGVGGGSNRSDLEIDPRTILVYRSPGRPWCQSGRRACKRTMVWTSSDEDEGGAEKKSANSTRKRQRTLPSTSTSGGLSAAPDPSGGLSAASDPSPANSGLSAASDPSPDTSGGLSAACRRDPSPGTSGGLSAASSGSGASHQNPNNHKNKVTKKRKKKLSQWDSSDDEEEDEVDQNRRAEELAALWAREQADALADEARRAKEAHFAEQARRAKEARENPPKNFMCPIGHELMRGKC